ncbi:MAG: GxxExxY protein [Candidatus Omnitrophota bacterium]
MKELKATTDYADSYKYLQGGGNPRKSVVNKREKDYPYKEYAADIIFERIVLVELKATKGVTKIDKAQVHNYLKETQKRIGLQINFGKVSLEYKR